MGLLLWLRQRACQDVHPLLLTGGATVPGVSCSGDTVSFPVPLSPDHSSCLTLVELPGTQEEIIQGFFTLSYW